MAKKVRLVSEESLTGQVEGIVTSSLSGDDTIRQAALDAVAASATNIDTFTQVFPTKSQSLRASQEGRGALVIILDDARLNNYEIAVPAVEAVGGHITLAITTGNLGKDGYMTPAQVKDTADRGHEIAWHSVNHRPMSEISPAERAIEWGAKEELEAMTGYPVVSAAFTHNASNRAANQEAYQRFTHAYTGQFSPYFTDRVNAEPTFLRGRMSWSGVESQRRVLAGIRKAAAEGSVLTIFSHNVDGSNLSGGIEEWQLHEVCALTAELGIPIIRARDAHPGVAQIPNAGFEDPNLEQLGHYVFRQTDALNTIESVAVAPQTGFPGERSLRIRGDGTKNPELLLAYPPYAIKSAEPVTVSCRLRVSKNGGQGNGAYIRVDQRDAFNESLGVLQGPFVNQSQDWGQYVFTFTPDVECASIRVSFGSEGIAGDVFFDHVHLGDARFGVLG